MLAGVLVSGSLYLATKQEQQRNKIEHFVKVFDFVSYW